MPEWIQVQKKPTTVRVRGPVQSPETHDSHAGELEADVGDYIVDDGDTEYPVKPDIFHDTYEVEPDDEMVDSENDTTWFKATKIPVTVQARELTEGRTVETREGVVQAEAGNYLIKGVDGEIYPVRPDLFRRKYKILDNL